MCTWTTIVMSVLGLCWCLNYLDNFRCHQHKRSQTSLIHVLVRLPLNHTLFFTSSTWLSFSRFWVIIFLILLIVLFCCHCSYSSFRDSFSSIWIKVSYVCYLQTVSILHRNDRFSKLDIFPILDFSFWTKHPLRVRGSFS